MKPTGVDWGSANLPFFLLIPSTGKEDTVLTKFQVGGGMPCSVVLVLHHVQRQSVMNLGYRDSVSSDSSLLWGYCFSHSVVRVSWDATMYLSFYLSPFYFLPLPTY